jgi:hypothetical protein
MAQIPNSIPLGGPIAPTDDQDSYATHFAKYGQGGWRAVVDEVARDAISDDRREEGMAVFVLSSGKVFVLSGGITNSNWVEWSGGGVALTARVDKYEIDSIIISNGYIDLTYIPNTAKAHVDVIVNGLILEDGASGDYVLLSNRVTFSFPIEIGDRVIVKYFV